MKKFKHLLTALLLLMTGIVAFGQSTWSEVEWSSITATDEIIITMTTDNGSGTTYALPNNGGNATPEAVTMSYSSGAISITTSGYATDDLLWNINTSAGKIYPNGSTATWLYTTNSNSGVRIGTNTTNGHVWLLDGNYLKTNEGTNDRWLGVYTNKPDWRAYKNTTGNTKNQVVKFYKLNAGSTVATPTFNPAGGIYTTAQNVSIACTTSGATIRYTTNGDVPSETSEVYSTPIPVSSTTTIKAKAWKSGIPASDVASATYTFASVIDIAAARVLAIETTATVQGVVTFIDGRNIYIQDSTAAIDLFLNNGTVPASLAVGDLVQATGEIALYNGLIELSGIDGSNSNQFSIISTGNTLPIAEKTIAEILADFNGSNMLQSTRVEIVDATIGAINNNGNTTITQEDNTLNIYRLPTVTGLMEGDWVTVKGVIGCYNTPQLRVNSADDVEFTHRPHLNGTPTSLSGFNYVVENGPSETQHFTLSGSYLTGQVSVIPSANYDISFTDGAIFSPENPGTITPPQSGNIYGLNVYIRLKAGLSVGTYNEQILVASQNVDTLEISVSGSVTEEGGGGNAGEYTKITDIADLAVGSQVIFAARHDSTANSYYAMENATTGKPTGILITTTTSGSNEIIPSIISGDESNYYWTVGMIGSNYTFTNADGEVIGYNSGTNFATGGDNTAWTVTSDTSDTAAMVPNYTAFTFVNANNTGRAFALNTSHKFGAYSTSNMTGSNAANYNFYLDLFVKGEGTGTQTVATPSFTPATGTYYETQNVSISCATVDATIYYTTNGNDPDETSTLYTGSFDITETTTVKAIAYKEGMNASNIASATYTIQVGVIAIFDQDWEGDMNGWTFVSTEGTAEWTIASYNNNHYAYANGYNAGANVDWCISPSFNLNNYNNVILSFISAKNYTGPDLEVYFSNDYNGSTPATATWIPLSCTLSTGNWTWTPSGDIALSSFNGDNCYIAFKYTSTETEAAGWELDDCLLVGNTTNPIVSATPSTLNGFSYIVGNGPSIEQSFTVSGMNLTADVNIAATTNYEISLTSGEAFAAQPSITITQNNGNVSETTIYVRLKADLTVGNYNAEQITISSTGANNATVTCNGSVTEEGSNEEWHRIAAVSELLDGCKIIVAARHDANINSYYVMPSVTSGKPEGVLCASVISGADEILPVEISENAETYYWNVTFSGSNFVFTNAAGDTIGYGGSGTNFLTGSNNAAWMIENGTSGESAMVPNYVAFNITNAAYTRGFALNTSFKFGAYATSNNNSADYNFYLDIFMQGEGGTPTVAAPSFSPASGTYYEPQTVTITCGTADATIFYSTISENGPWETYTSEIPVNESMTIWSYAEKEEYNNSIIVRAEYVINDNINIIFNQDWEDGWNGWSAVNTGGSAEWTIASYNNNHYAFINGYNEGANEDWLISPAFNLDSYENTVLTFKTAMNYTGNDLEVYFSNNYDGSNTSTATWQALSCALSQGSWEWVESGAISMDSLDGTNCYIAFKYTCTDTEASAWEVDDIMLVSGEIGANLTAVPNAISGLNYLEGEGPSESQSYVLSATNLEAQDVISATASEGFEISLDGTSFEDAIEIVYEETPATVYVRMKSALEIGLHEGTVSHVCSDVNATVTLSGEVISASAPGISEEVVPMYIQGMNGTNNNRLPFAFRLSFSNLTPNATYRYINQIVDSNDGETANGAGNIIFVNNGVFFRTTSPSLDTEGEYGQFTTDANGNYSGWFMSETTANTRFTPGNHVYMRVRTNDGNEGTTAVNYFTTNNYATVINFGTENNEYDGTAIYGISGNNPKDFVFLYDNVDGLGRPIYGTSIETTGIDYTSISQYATFYKEEVAGQNGHWGGIVPNVNENGIQYVAILENENGALVDSYTNETGVWGDENTINPVGGLNDIIVLDFIGLNVQSDAESNIKVWNTRNEILIANAGNDNYHMTVYTLVGQPVMTTEIYGQGTRRINHNLTKGLYIIILQNNSTMISTKIIVK
jgi:hypothetical protein